MLVKFNNNINHDYLFYTLKFMDLEAHKLIFYNVSGEQEVIDICEDIIHNNIPFASNSSKYYTEEVKPIFNSNIKRFLLETSKYNSIEKYEGAGLPFVSGHTTYYTAVIYGYREKPEDRELVCYFAFGPDDNVSIPASYAYKVDPLLWKRLRVVKWEAGGTNYVYENYPDPTIVDINGEAITSGVTTTTVNKSYYTGTSYVGDKDYPEGTTSIKYYDYYKYIEITNPPVSPAYLTLEVPQPNRNVTILTKASAIDLWVLQRDIRITGDVRISFVSTESGIMNINKHYADLLSRFRPLL